MTRLVELDVTPAERVGARPTVTVRRGALPCAPEVLVDCPVLHPYGDWSGRVGSRILTAGQVGLAGVEYGLISMSVVLGAGGVAAGGGGDVGGRAGVLWHSVVLTATPAVFVAAWRQGGLSDAAGLLDWFPVLSRLPGAPAPIPPPGDEGLAFVEEMVRLVRAVSGPRVAVTMPASAVEGERLVLAWLARGVVRTGRSPGIEASDPCELIVVPDGVWSGLPVREGRTLVG